MSGVGAVGAELIAVLVAVTAGTPRVLTIGRGQALPSGPFAVEHRSLQAGLRAWVEEQTRHPLGYVEQLYTFADRDRGPESERRISVSYLGLTRELKMDGSTEQGWRDWYGYFPWEDHRAGPPPLIAALLGPALAQWSEAARDGAIRAARRARAANTFGLDGRPWNEELALQRYELLFEAGLVPENGGAAAPGAPMLSDHRRILATAMARLRAKIKYRPVVFELMPPQFTLLQLQRSVECVAGRPVHRSNFRRLIEEQELVEETGEVAADTGGRPARLVRFRRDVVEERALTGSKLPLARS